MTALPAWTDLPAYFPDPHHRVWLRRRLSGKGPPVAFILHNPTSLMDESTMRRLSACANAWGCSDAVAVGLATQIAASAGDLIGRDLFKMATDATDAAAQFVGGAGGKFVAVWGTPSGPTGIQSGMSLMAEMIKWRYQPLGLHVLRLTPSGYPEHPLYLPRHLVPIPWGS